VIKRQQEILQIIIGCNCSETTEPTPVDVTTTTTAAPAFAAKGNFVKPGVNVNVPVDTRIPTVAPAVSVKPFDQGKVTYVEDKISIIDGV
jgi:hypothetical protein